MYLSNIFQRYKFLTYNKILNLIINFFNIQLLSLTDFQDKKLKEFFSLFKVYKCDKGLIRVGGRGDGSYILPNDFKNIKYCISPGFGNKFTFEKDLYARGIKSFVFDKQYNRKDVPQFINFTKRNINKFSLDKIVKKIPSNNLILQMDIEGDEWEVLFHLKRNLLKRFRIIVIEFHKMNLLLQTTNIEFYISIFKKLLELHKIVFIQANNSGFVTKYKSFQISSMMEFTFLREDRLLKKQLIKSLDYKYQEKNSPNLDIQKLSKHWF
jgi:FkbM family methyltransferase